MRAVICQIGCAAECSHGVPCVIGSFGGIDADHPHPMARGREQHYGNDGAHHEWNGEHGRCRVSADDPDPDSAPPRLVITIDPGPLL